MEIADKRTVICGVRSHGEFVPMNESSYEFRLVFRDDMDYIIHRDQLDHEVTSGSGSSDLIPIGSWIDILNFNSDYRLSVQNPPYLVSQLSQSSHGTACFNQIKAALLIEDRTLRELNNLSQVDTQILQGLRLSDSNCREEFVPIFNRLFSLSNGFPRKVGCKIHRVVDNILNDTVVLAFPLADGDRLTSVSDILSTSSLMAPRCRVMCQGLLLDHSTPTYYIREHFIQADGFIHLVVHEQ